MPSVTNPALDATIPAGVIIELGRLGGTVLDLVHFLMSQGVLDAGEISQGVAFQSLTEQYLSAKAAAEAATGGVKARDTSMDRIVYRALVAGLRSLPISEGARQKLWWGDPMLNSEVWNDLDWTAILRLVFSASVIIRSVSEVPLGGTGPQGTFAVFDFAGYRFAVEAVDVRNMAEHWVRVSAKLEELRGDEGSPTPIFIAFHIFGRPDVAAVTALVSAETQLIPHNLISVMDDLAT